MVGSSSKKSPASWWISNAVCFSPFTGIDFPQIWQNSTLALSTPLYPAVGVWGPRWSACVIACHIVNLSLCVLRATSTSKSCCPGVPLPLTCAHAPARVAAGPSPVLALRGVLRLSQGIWRADNLQTARD